MYIGNCFALSPVGNTLASVPNATFTPAATAFLKPACLSSAIAAFFFSTSSGHPIDFPIVLMYCMS